MRLHLVLLVWWLSALSLIGGKALSANQPVQKNAVSGIEYSLELEKSIISDDCLISTPLQVPAELVQLFIGQSGTYKLAIAIDGKSQTSIYPLALTTVNLTAHTILINAP